MTRDINDRKPITQSSAPCRIDLGGTLDLSTFSYPLMHLSPCTFNMAVGLRTRVRIQSFEEGVVRISAGGIDDAVFPSDRLPFDHPLGLMFAIAHYFRADGIQIVIDSSSPTRSALGGSSVAAVALVAALAKHYPMLPHYPKNKAEMALLARDMEALTVQTPCGIQDHLAAAYGGIHAWHWRPGLAGKGFIKKTIMPRHKARQLEPCLLLAYCGAPHESISVNNQWVRQFMSGQYRDKWADIVALTRTFIDALSQGNIKKACRAMNSETEIRMVLTPEVLDDVGMQLFEKATENRCSARFSGAGGGGCVWALGEAEDIARLRFVWEAVLDRFEGAGMLDMTLDFDGVLIH